MAYEYRAELATPLDVNQQQALLSWIRANADWKVVRDADNQISLRFADSAPSSTWPEDLAFTFEPSGIRIALYAGNRARRAAVLALVEAELERAGLTTRFEDA